MKLVHISCCLSLLVSACTSNSSSSEPSAPSEPLGGQTGDDGDVMPSEPTPAPSGSNPPQVPGEPIIDNCKGEQKTLKPDEPSIFGKTAEELLAALAPPTTSLHWVNFDSIEETQYAPGPGESHLSLELQLGDGSIEQTQRLPRTSDPDAVCAGNRLAIPVSVHLSTEDGALDEHFEATLDVSSAASARVRYQLLATEIAGSFAITQAGGAELGQIWTFDSLNFDISLWPGGSRGMVIPDFTLENPPTIATPPATPPSPTAKPTSTPSDPNEVFTPEHWWSVAVWPTKAQCKDGRQLVSPDDAVLGFSANDAMQLLQEHTDWQLTGDSGTSRVHFEPDALPDALCVDSSGLRPELRFSAPATLRSLSPVTVTRATGTGGPNGVDGGGTDAGNPDVNNADAGLTMDAGTTVSDPLQGLDTSLWVSVVVSPVKNDTRIQQIVFERRVDDVVFDMTRTEFTGSTKVVLDVADEYQRFWWSWQGRVSADGERYGRFIVSSLNAEQSQAIDQQVAEGGPGAGIGFDPDTGWAKLPGTLLLDVESPW